MSLTNGIVKIYAAGNSASAGNMPITSMGALKETLRYEERTVGLTRYFKALQSGVTISRLIRCQKRTSVNTLDIAELDGNKYKIMLVQYPDNVSPPMMDLSLERLSP